MYSVVRRRMVAIRLHAHETERVETAASYDHGDGCQQCPVIGTQHGTL